MGSQLLFILMCFDFKFQRCLQCLVSCLRLVLYINQKYLLERNIKMDINSAGHLQSSLIFNYSENYGCDPQPTHCRAIKFILLELFKGSFP